MELRLTPVVLFLIISISTASSFAITDWVFWDDETWTITSTRPLPGTFTAWLPQSNGYIGLAQGSLGPFFELSRANDSEGWPSYSSPRTTFGTVTGFYGSEPSVTDELDPNRGESFLSGVPHFTDLLVEACGRDVLDGSTDVSEIEGFASTLSFSEGIATWSYTWHPPSCGIDHGGISIKYESFLSLADRQLAAVQLFISSASGLDQIAIIDKLDDRGALRTTAISLQSSEQDGNEFLLTAAVSPVSVEGTTAYVVSKLEGDALMASNMTYPILPLDNWVFSENTTRQTIGQSGSVRRYQILPGAKSTTVTKYVGVASSDHFGVQARDIALKTAKDAQARGYKHAYKSHVNQVSRIMASPFVADFRDPSTGELPDDITVKALQITAISSSYYLFTNLLPFDPAVDSDPATCQACNSLPVGGLSAQSYGGKVFWDADMFMAPPVQSTHPRLARQFSLYRINRADQTRENTARHGLKPGSMLYPWTSGRYGQCYNISAPCVMYQYHLNADIALSMVMARNTSGDRDWFEREGGAADVLDGVAMGLGEVLSHRNDTGKWGIDVMTDADEYYMFVADGAFTLMATSVLLENAANLRRQRGEALEERWEEQMGNMAIPMSSSSEGEGDSIVLEFRDMPDSIVSKQADVILGHFPYDYRRHELATAKQRRRAMDYYAVRQDSHGPAMTWTLYAIASNTLATSGCAFWTFLVKSVEPYLRMPWFQYSEQQDDHSTQDDPLTGRPINPAFPFLTGHGGLLQVFTAGLLGLKVTDVHLVIRPALPPQLSHFRPSVQFYNGAVVSFRMNRTHTEVTRLDARLFDGLVPDQYGAAAMPITVGRSVLSDHDSNSNNNNDDDNDDDDDEKAYTIYLSINQTAVILNRIYDVNPSVPGNMLQCLAATSPDPFQSGQYPVAATDGYAGTAWQPRNGDNTKKNSAPSSLVVDTSSHKPTPLRAVYFDFGARPPRRVTVLLSNSTSSSSHSSGHDNISGMAAEGWVSIASQNITISQPYDPDAPVHVSPGNTTTIMFSDDHPWTGRYARLDIEGCWAADDSEGGAQLGATVAEFALLV